MQTQQPVVATAMSLLHGAICGAFDYGRNTTNYPNGERLRVKLLSDGTVGVEKIENAGVPAPSPLSFDFTLQRKYDENNEYTDINLLTQEANDLEFEHGVIVDRWIASLLERKSKPRNGSFAAIALCALLLAIPAHSQTTTDHQTRCETDSSDVTTCNTQPNYAEELRRAQADERARREEDARFWEHIDQQRREGDQRNEVKKKL